MKITTNVTVEDYVYEFYFNVAQDMGNIRPGEVMSRALLMYTYLVALTLQDDLKDSLF